MHGQAYLKTDQRTIYMQYVYRDMHCRTSEGTDVLKIGVTVSL